MGNGGQDGRVGGAKSNESLRWREEEEQRTETRTRRKGKKRVQCNETQVEQREIKDGKGYPVDLG